MAQSKPVSRRKVLVVEDEPLLRLMAIDVVEDAGFEAIEAADADEAVRILESRDDICLIFTDIQMPGSMDGVKLAGAVRDRWPPIHIIVTSGHMKISDVLLPKGAVYVPKPYDLDLLAAQMKAMADLQ